MTKYDAKTYGQGFVLKVDPPDRAGDVIHYLTTGGLMGGRSLDGVTWEQVEDPERVKSAENRAKCLAAALLEIDA